MSLADDLVNAVFSGVPYESPTELYLALFTVAGEVVGGSYERVNVTGKFSLSVDGRTSNTAQIQFPTPTQDWGIINRYVFFSQQVGGEPLLYITADKDDSITTGNNVFINAGLISVGLVV